ncbi:hypothetical protein ACIGBL_24420 [Streptomyces sp. NPDC085614]
MHLAAGAGLARATAAHAGRLLDLIGEESAKELAPLSTRATWAVARLRA